MNGKSLSEIISLFKRANSVVFMNMYPRLLRKVTRPYYTAITREKLTPLHISCNNSVTRPPFKMLRGVS